MYRWCSLRREEQRLFRLPIYHRSKVVTYAKNGENLYKYVRNLGIPILVFRVSAKLYKMSASVLSPRSLKSFPCFVVVSIFAEISLIGDVGYKSFDSKF